MKSPYVDNPNPDQEPINLTDRPVSDIRKRLSEIMEYIATSNDPELLTRLQDAMTFTTNGHMTDGIGRYDNEQQHVTPDGKKLGISKPVVKTSSQSNLGSAWMQDTDGTGVFNVPLLASMIWVRLAKPALEDVTNLAERLLINRAQYGRESVGVVLSAVEADLIDDLVNFCIRHVTASTVKTNDLRSVILAPDYQVLLMAMAALMYPEGYRYDKTCQNIVESKDEEPTKSICGHVTKGTVALERTIIHGWSRVNDAQLDWMADRTTVRSKDAVREMQFGKDPKLNDEGDVLVEGVDPVASNRRLRYTVYTSSNGTSVVAIMRSPTLARYISTSQKWVRRMSTLADNVASKTKNDSEREAYIQAQLSITKVQQQAHLIYAMEMVNEEGEVLRSTDNPEGIDSIIRTYGDRKEFVNAMLEAFGDATGEMTMSWCGLPIAKCTSCGKTPEGYEEDQVMPIPAGLMLFTLAVYKSAEATRQTIS